MCSPRSLLGTTRDSSAVMHGKRKAVPSGMSVIAMIVVR